MGTRCFVAVSDNDPVLEKLEFIYIHFDGYPDGVGADLLSLEQTEDAVREFISHGDRSSSFGPYYKDQGETDVDPGISTFNGLIGTMDYLYVFRAGQWFVYGGDSRIPKLLKDVVHAI